MTVRPRIQRAFLTWLEEARARLRVPLHVERRTDRRMTVHFDGLSRSIEATLSRQGLSVSVLKGDTWWDWVYDDDVVPVRVRGGQVCDSCSGNERMIYPHRVALWCDHLFEPFLEWINTTLAVIWAVSLGRSSGCRWATLIPYGRTIEFAEQGLDENYLIVLCATGPVSVPTVDAACL